MTSKKRASLVFPISWAFFTLSIYNRISFSHVIKGFALFIFIFLATPALAATQELVVNGDFEDGTSGWTLSGAVVTSGGNQHAGTRYAVLGEINSSTDILSQIMTVPTNAGLATASFYYYIYTEEAPTGEYDTLDVDLINLTTDTTYSIAHLSNLDGGTCTSGSSCYEYLSKQIDLTGMDGDSIQIRFRSTMDADTFTSFKVDDVSLLVNIADEESVSAPTAVTDSATNITSSAATLNGTVNPNGLSTEVNFRWRKPDQDANPTNLYQDIGDGTSPVSVSTEISGLDPSTRYEFQVYAVNAINSSFGDWNTFTTSATTQPQCSDGIDNDGDGLIDYPNDPDCTDSNDTSEQESFGGDTLDIEVSDGPDPFTPSNGEINTITVSNVGTVDCDLTLTIENAVEESPLTTLAHGTTMDFPWDGRNSGGELVPAGDYTYTAECAQTRNSTAQSWWGKVFAWFTNTAHAFFSDTETGTITVLASGEPQSPTCDLFTANPTTITKGESTTLTWESSNAVDAIIDNGVGSVSVDGSTTVQPQETTTYMATFTGETDDATTCSVDVTVVEQEPTTATITLFKEVINDDEGELEPSDFVLRLDGQMLSSGILVEVEAGTYTIDEDEVEGYEFVSITGDEKCPSEPGGTITLDAGENVVCTVTNDDVVTLPVIMLPGIMGTQLLQERFGPDDLIWVDRNQVLTDDGDGFLNALEVNENGESVNQIRTGDLIRQTFIDTYGDLINRIEEEGFEEGTNLFTFPYDWRLDNRNAADQLADSIETILNDTDSQRVNVVVHSMGGLVLRSYIARHGSENINKVIFIGTPQIGSTNAFNALAFDATLTNNFMDIPAVNTQTLTDLAKQFPSVYQLLPRYPFLTYRGTALSLDQTYVPQLDGMDLMETTHLNSYTAIGNEIVSDSNISNIEQISIVGSSLATLGNLNANQSDTGVCWDPQPVNGDGTVPVSSADEVFGNPTQIIYTNSGNHSELPNEDNVGDLIALLLTDKEIQDRNGTFLADNFSNNQYALQGTLTWSTCSPVQVEITNQLDNVNGFDDEDNLRMEIPQSNFFKLGHGEGGFLPSNEDYILKLNAFEAGTFSLFIKKTVDDSDNSEPVATYEDIPVTERSVGEITVSQDGSNNVLSVDLDGDGTTDYSVKSGAFPTQGDYIETIISIISNVDLEKGIQKSLLAKLNNAKASVKRNNENSVKGQINAFIKEVGALRGNKLSEALAESVTRLATASLAPQD